MGVTQRLLEEHFTMANIIEKVQKPTLVISHNKPWRPTTANSKSFSRQRGGILCLYYDYYQPEARAFTDTYIEKDSDINEIEKLCATRPQRLWRAGDGNHRLKRILSSGLGSPFDYENHAVAAAGHGKIARIFCATGGHRIYPQRYGLHQRHVPGAGRCDRHLSGRSGKRAVRVELFGDKWKPLKRSINDRRNHRIAHTLPFARLPHYVTTKKTSKNAALTIGEG